MRKHILRLFSFIIFIASSFGLSAANDSQAEPTDPADQAAASSVFWTETVTGKIMHGNADGSGSAQTCKSDEANPRGLVVVAELGKIYWIERDAGRLRRANINCTGFETIGPPLINPDRMAIDVAGGKIYWTENQTATVQSNRIRRANLDGTSAQTILSGLNSPAGIAVDSVNNYLYWTEFAGDSIWRWPLGGGNKTLLLQLSDTGNPLEIVLDVARNKMYWVESDGIYTGTLTAGGRSLWGSQDQVPRSLALDADAGKIYWSEWGDTPEIRRANLDKSNSQQLFNAADGVDRPLGVGLMLEETACYTLTINTSPSGGGSVNVSPQRDCYDDGEQVTLTASANTGYRFAGWSGDISGTNNPRNLTMNANKSVTAIFDACYSLSLSHTGNGGNPTANPTSSSGCGSGKYSVGESITLTASPASGWRVDYWSGTNNDSSTANNNTLTMPSGNHSASVTYEQIPITCYTLTLSHTGSGGNPTANPTASAGCTAGSYTVGQSITLTASPASGWQVDYWTGTNNDGSIETSNTLTMPGNDHAAGVTYKQVPTTCYTLSRSHTGSGNDPIANPPYSEGCGTGQYSAGQLITLTASPAAGWSVGGWSGTDNDSSPSVTNTLMMPAASRAVSVAYVAIPPTCYSLARGHTGNGTDPVASPALSTGCVTGEYTFGQSITLTASPASGWRVAGWSGTNNDGSTGNTNTVIMPARDHAVGVTYQVIVTPTGGRVFVPISANIPYEPPVTDCFGPEEIESNNSASAANGPLCSGRTVSGLPRDQWDYFYFETITEGTIAIEVFNLKTDDAQLVLHYQAVSGDPEDSDTGVSDGLKINYPNAKPGRYYVFIYVNKPIETETQRYTMELSFP